MAKKSFKGYHHAVKAGDNTIGILLRGPLTSRGGVASYFLHFLDQKVQGKFCDVINLLMSSGLSHFTTLSSQTTSNLSLQSVLLLLCSLTTIYALTTVQLRDENHSRTAHFTYSVPCNS